MVGAVRRYGVNAFTIWRLGEPDIGSFRDLRLEALQRNPDAFGASYHVEAAFTHPRWAQWLTEATVLGAFDDQVQLIGCASLSPTPGEKRQHVGQFGAFYTTPAWRGQGVADALLAASLKAGNGRFLRIVLTVNAENPKALNLYQRHGFTEYGRLHCALFVDGVYYDEVLMVHEMLQNSN